MCQGPMLQMMGLRLPSHFLLELKSYNLPFFMFYMDGLIFVTIFDHFSVYTLCSTFGTSMVRRPQASGLMIINPRYKMNFHLAYSSTFLWPHLVTFALTPTWTWLICRYIVLENAAKAFSYIFSNYWWQNYRWHGGKYTTTRRLPWLNIVVKAYFTIIVHSRKVHWNPPANQPLTE